MNTFRDFMVRNGLIDPSMGERIVRFTWCCDGPFDVQQFLVKQCFISNIAIPEWINGNFIDVKAMVKEWHASVLRQAHRARPEQPSPTIPKELPYPLSIRRQLEVLGLPPFKGREHCGIDDTRNITRIIAELARRGMVLKPNTVFDPHRRWSWMGADGTVTGYGRY